MFLPMDLSRSISKFLKLMLFWYDWYLTSDNRKRVYYTFIYKLFTYLNTYIFTFWKGVYRKSGAVSTA